MSAEYQPQWPSVRRWLEAASRDFTAQLDMVKHDDEQVPNLFWTARELAAHVAALPSAYLDQLDPTKAPTASEWRSHVLNHTAPLLGREFDELKPKIVEQTERLIDAVDVAPDAQWMMFGIATTATKVAAGYLGELLIHGRDLAKLTGAKVAISVDQAIAVIDHRMTLRPAVVRSELLAFAPDGDYVTVLRGGPTYVAHKVDHRIDVHQGNSPSPVTTISAPPVMYLLFHYGRTTRGRAFFSGMWARYRRQNGPGQYGTAHRIGLPPLVPDIDLVTP